MECYGQCLLIWTLPQNRFIIFTLRLFYYSKSEFLQAAQFKVGDRVGLVDNSMSEGLDLAVLTIESIWQPDKAREAELVFGANDRAHPSVAYLWDEAGSHYIGGTVEGIILPPHYDFPSLRSKRSIPSFFSPMVTSSFN